MLQEILQWADRQGQVLPPGFKIKPVRWVLVFDEGGGFRLVRELGDPGARRNRGEHLPCPNLELGEMKRGGTGTRHFLVDTAQVVALLGAEQDDPKAAAKHDSFLSLLSSAASALPVLDRIAAALRDPEVRETVRTGLEDKGAGATENVTFEVQGADPPLLVSDPAWHDWYQGFREGLQPERSGPKMRCLVTGKLVEPLATHPKIKGLADVGGLSMGDVLPAFKQASFRSYGLEQAANAAMSEEVAAGYTAALNRLIRNRSQKLAGNRILYWYREPVPDEDQVPDWIESPPGTAEADALERARGLLRSIEAGERPDLAGNRYFALTLSANSGRVVLRDWMEGSYPELVRNVAAWFDDLRVVDRSGTGWSRPPKMWAVLGALVRDLKDVPDPLAARLWRVAVRNEPIPAQAAARALARFRIAVMKNDYLSVAGVGLLKAFLRRAPGSQGDPNMTPALNEDHPHPAYHCGRLMATLAYLQWRALGDVGAGVVQRYYAAASATPALVLGRLLKLAQYHLAKLEGGERHWIDERIGQIMGRLVDEFPTTLNLEEQSLFALGYYHQKAHRPTRDGAADESADSVSETSQETE